MLTEKELKQFVKENNLIGYAISVIFALTIKDVLSDFIGNLLIPSINIFLRSLNLKQLTHYLPGKSKIEFQPFVKSLLTFLLSFLLIYLMIVITFKDWMIKKT
jgi:large-conductance mechanosensitive channel